MNEIYLPNRELPRLLDALAAEREVVVFTAGGGVPLAEMEDGVEALRAPRSPFPAKSFLLPMRETVAQYATIEGVDAGEPAAAAVKPPALVNLRSCDLAAIAVLDRIFLEGTHADPFYQERRERLLIVSVDCARITEHCFCHMVGNAPVVEKGMGINLTPVADGFVARADTPEGQAGLDAAGLRAPVTPEHRAQAAATEERTRQELEESNERFSWNGSSFHGLLGGEVSPDAWNDLFASCVECGSCTSLCPTCYCFYMVDRSRSGAPPAAYEKLRSWDSCLLSDYSRMAGGDGMKPTPRPRLRSRYENRLRHKFQYFHETHGQYGCTGCGRCSAACSATADPREVMRVLAQ